MNSLRSKLWFGVGGLLLILVLVSVTSVVVLTFYKDALEQTFRENYDSALFCDGMKAALDNVNNRAQRLIWDHIDTPAQPDLERFDDNLVRQNQNITLPGERGLTDRVGELWTQYKRLYTQFDSPAADRQSVYRDELLPLGEQIKSTVQRISDMNMNNMVSVDGQVKRTLWKVRGVVVLLVAIGTVLATGFTGIVGASILRSIRALTRSAHEIEAGNLDMVVSVGSRDEFGQLAEAFNSMASRLREFRKLDHERLVRTQHTTQLAIDSLPDAVFVIGPDARIEISNRLAQTHFAAMPGVSISMLKLHWLSELYERIRSDRQPIEPADYKSAVQLFEEGSKGGNNGGERFLLPHARPMLAEDGSLVGVTVILVDVTALRHADELKSDLVSTVSHELRTPLTSIRMGTLLLAEEALGPLNARQRKSVEAVRDDSDRLHRTIENLLSMSRIEAGRAQFQFRQMSACEIVSQAVDPMRSGFAEKRIKLDVHVDEEMPEVSADPNCIGLALTNLLSNALKYTHAGGSTWLRVEHVADEIRFTVSDTGPGIPPEHVAHIFEKFYRVPTRDGPTGAGLGLAITREIVTAHGGGLKLESARPATFVFTLPVLKVPAVAV